MKKRITPKQALGAFLSIGSLALGAAIDEKFPNMDPLIFFGCVLVGTVIFVAGGYLASNP